MMYSLAMEDLEKARERIAELEAALRTVVEMFESYTRSYGPGWDMEDVEKAKALLDRRA